MCKNWYVYMLLLAILRPRYNSDTCRRLVEFSWSIFRAASLLMKVDQSWQRSLLLPTCMSIRIENYIHENIQTQNLKSANDKHFLGRERIIDLLPLNI